MNIPQNTVELSLIGIFVQVWTEYERYTITIILSEIGGIVGLFMGLSIYTTVKFSLDFFKNCKKRMSAFAI